MTIIGNACKTIYRNTDETWEAAEPISRDLTWDLVVSHSAEAQGILSFLVVRIEALLGVGCTHPRVSTATVIWARVSFGRFHFCSQPLGLGFGHEECLILLADD